MADSPKLTSAANSPLGIGGSASVNPDEFARYLGLASWLMTMSEDHNELALKVLDERILPAILLKQFRMFSKGKMPIAFLTWAMVSDAVAERLNQSGGTPELKEWRTGKNLIIVDCVSPFGPVEKIKKEFLASMKA